MGPPQAPGAAVTGRHPREGGDPGLVLQEKDWIPAFAGMTLFLASFAFYLRQAAPAVTAGDSGEFITAAATLSLAHAPSYPLYSLLGRLFIQILPLGSIALRMNIFSALTSSAALTVLFLIARRLGAGVLVSTLMAILVGLSTSFWMNSLVTEVFALNSLWACLLLWCLVNRKEDRRFDLLAVFLVGLGLGNHHTLVLVAPAYAAAAALEGDGKWLLQRSWLLALFALLGFSIYLFLPIRSAKEPPLNWGQPTTVEKFARTITRKDYGSLRLALGEAPARTPENLGRHLKGFFRQTRREVTWPLAALALIGLIVGLRRDRALASALLLLFVLAGPFFIALGNLPFNAQSEGIMGRFYVLPMIALLLGLVPLARLYPRISPAVLSAAAVVLLGRVYAEASGHRMNTLVLDYGRAMLRTLPRGGVLFMDGGDDAFYSTAALHYVAGSRPDLELHDRGGLIFRNVYGADFRRITPEEKKRRRTEVEKSYLGRKPIFYSTMDLTVLPGVPTRQVGFLIEASFPRTPPLMQIDAGYVPPIILIVETGRKRESSPLAEGKELDPRLRGDDRISWPVICLRSLYPLATHDYRTRALGCFFPYMQGRALLQQGKPEAGLRHFRRAGLIGDGVDWLRENMGLDYAYLALGTLNSGKTEAAERVYKEWLRFDPQSAQAQINLGVVFERTGRLAEAREQYRRAAAMFPDQADPVFNLAVLSWQESDWKSVVSYLEEVLKRKPDHAAAARYIAQARMRLAAGEGR